ncbi:MAG: CBS domain-containing protein [Enterobacterales bacterium]|nr:CBS domain-containing protein [Enterobacterales bacterium]
MQVKEIMTKAVVTVSMDDNTKAIKQIFSKTHFHHLLVVENKQLVGIISDRDLFKSLSPNIGTASETEKDAATLNKRAHQIMSRKPKSLASDADIYDAIAIFNRSDISCIPIVDHTNKPIGILSWRDILRILEKLRKH